MSESDEGVSTSLLGNRATSPPVAQRSSKSFVSQVKNTLFSFIKKAKGEADTVSQKQRGLESFTERVATFTVSKWMAKPLALSPPLFAQYGWQCIGVDTVKCCSCAAVMCVRLPWPDADNYRQQCFDYRQRVITSHMKICSWPSYPCSNSFVSPFFHSSASPSEILSQYQEREKNLIKLGTKLPNLDPNITTALNLSKADLRVLCQTQQDSESNASDTVESQSNFTVEITAAILAMCGWDTSHSLDSKSPTIICENSGRVMSLRNFFQLGSNSLYSDSDESHSQAAALLTSNGQSTLKRRLSTTNGEDSQSPIKKLKTATESALGSPRGKTITKQNFHPLEQHSPWSFWITTLNPISKVEFESDAAKKGASVSDKDQNDDLYHFIINPTMKEAKPGWLAVKNTILDKKNTSEKVQNVTNESSNSISDGNSPARDQTNLDAKIAASGSPVIHVRKLLKEWSRYK
uniref:nuclear-interacting partner of ALK-like n=1 Tax=Styela clava TaxID=7725 RepID=UPI001939511E|nr:nuclear-interacting partner of ALK-like [Styela clava]